MPTFQAKVVRVTRFMGEKNEPEAEKVEVEVQPGTDTKLGSEQGALLVLGLGPAHVGKFKKNAVVSITIE